MVLWFGKKQCKSLQKMKLPVKRIAIIGPESTGKSWLCEKLADYYNTIWVREYAREYLPLLNRKYTIDDIVKIYETQFQQESILLLNANKFIFTDTEFIIAKVWCENAFGVCPEIITERIKNNPYDYYLLTTPDIPWQQDPLRENPGKGDYFFKWYEKILLEEKLNFGVVSGLNDNRLLWSIELIEQLPTV
jgi:NadR type nicotinamide-nucleotide adenylyltransferase